MSKYKCSPDIYAQLKRLVLIVFILFCLFSQSIPLFVGALLITAILFLATPANVEINDDNITIYGPIRPIKTINFADILNIKEVTSMASEFHGSGSVTFAFLDSFGYTDNRRNQIIGDARWYCSQLKNYVIIETEKKKFVISPDDPAALIADIKRRHPALV